MIQLITSDNAQYSTVQSYPASLLPVFIVTVHFVIIKLKRDHLKNIKVYFPPLFT